MSDFDSFIISSKITKLFPSCDSDTEWLIRLMFLHGDLSFEFQNLFLNENDNNEKIWQTSYFLRRIMISLKEIHNIFDYNLKHFIKKNNSEYFKKLSPDLSETFKQTKHTVSLITDYRNAIGAHFRPQNLDKNTKNNKNVVTRFLENFPCLQGELQIGIYDYRISNYKQLTSNSSLLLFPDVYNEEELNQEQEELRDAIINTAPLALKTIDAVLLWYWIKNGVLKAPPEMELLFK